MSDLNLKEQQAVRVALRHLKLRLKTWGTVAEALHLKYDTIEKVVNGRGPVSVRVAFRVAHLLDVPLSDLISGDLLRSACPHCGYIPDFAGDEPTRVEDIAPREIDEGPRPVPGGGLKLVK